MQKLTIAFLLLCFVFSPQWAFAQNPFPGKGELWKDGIVPKIHISLAAEDLDEILDPDNQNSVEEFPATFQFDNGIINETVENVGFRLRGNTSRRSAKKSFKVKFNKFVQGQKFEGIEDLNLNGEHNDASISRSKICWDLLREIKVPAPRANHVELYINGNYYGLYANIEHIDDEFVQQRFGNDDGDLYKCTWPVDFIYRGINSQTYASAGYDLQNNGGTDYSDLIEFLDILNRTPPADLPCKLEEVFNVDNYLKVIAFDIFSGNWDGPIYNKNNCYLYKNTATGKFEYIPFDLDNTFGVSWFPNIDWTTRDIYNWGNNDEARPIYEKILAVPEYRNRYSFYFNEFLKTAMNPAELNPKIDALKNLITNAAERDTFRTKDYNFSVDDFLNSFESSSVHSHLPHGFKEFINLRHQSADDQLEVRDILPVISDLSAIYYPASNQFQFTVKTFDDGDDLTVEVFYDSGGGNLNSIQLFDDGNHNDKNADDGIFSNNVFVNSDLDFLKFHAQVTDNQQNKSRLPRCFERQFLFDSKIKGLVINEFMASNTAAFADDDGEFDDWIELYNSGNEPINLQGIFITDNLRNPDKFSLPDVTLLPNNYYLVWADENGSEGDQHANFKLSSSGEEIGIFQKSDDVFVALDTLTFGQQTTDISYGRSPNGTGDFQALNWISPEGNNDVQVSVFDLKNEVNFEIFPNPFSDEFFIEMENEELKIENYKMLIFNNLGQKILATDYSKNQIDLSSNCFSKGIYFLVLKNKAGEIIGSKLIEKI